MKSSKLKNVFALLLIVAICTAFTVGLVACGNNNNDVYKPSVVMISYNSAIEDGSFNQLNWEGLKSSDKIKPSYREYLNASESFDVFLDNVISDKPDAVLVMDETVKNVILEKARQNTGILFGILDSGVEDVNLPENVFTCTFEVEQSSFLAGYLASETAFAAGQNKIGFIGGIQSPVIDKFLYGYKAGALYAGHNTVFDVKYTNSYTDKEAGRALANMMYNNDNTVSGGCHVIFQAAGTAGIGAIEAADALDKKIIGVDSDQSALAPGNVISSVIKNIGGTAKSIADKIGNGEKIGGKCFKYTLADGGVGIVETTLSDTMKTALAGLKSKIEKGELIVPSTSAEYDDFERALNA